MGFAKMVVSAKMDLIGILVSVPKVLEGTIANGISTIVGMFLAIRKMYQLFPNAKMGPILLIVYAMMDGPENCATIPRIKVL